MDFEVDGEPVDFSQTFTYKGVAYSDVPNLVSTFGYINASWTLRSDMIARYVCRLLNHMRGDRDRPVHAATARTPTPTCRRRPWIEGFSSGYMQRMMPMLPKQGDRAPWLNPQRYDADRKQLAQGQPRRRRDAVHPNPFDGAVPLTLRSASVGQAETTQCSRRRARAGDLGADAATARPAAAERAVEADHLRGVECMTRRLACPIAHRTTGHPRRTPRCAAARHHPRPSG